MTQHGGSEDEILDVSFCHQWYNNFFIVSVFLL